MGAVYFLALTAGFDLSSLGAVSECIVGNISDNFIHSPVPSQLAGGNITVNLLDMKYGLTLRCVWDEMVSI